MFHEEVILAGSGPDSTRRNQLIAWDTDADGDLTDETFVLDGENTRNIAVEADQSASPQNIEIAYMTMRNYYPTDDYKCDPNASRPQDDVLAFIKTTSNLGSDHWYVHHNTFEDLAIGCGYTFPDGTARGYSQYMVVRPVNANYFRFEHNVVRNIDSAYLMRFFSGVGMRIRHNVFSNFVSLIKIWNVGQFDLNDMDISYNTFNCTVDTWGAMSFSNDVQDSSITNNTFNDCRFAISFGTDVAAGKNDNSGHLVENNIINMSDQSRGKGVTGINVNDCTGPSPFTGDEMEVRDLIIRNNVIRMIGPNHPTNDFGIRLRTGHLHPAVNNFKSTTTPSKASTKASPLPRAASWRYRWTCTGRIWIERTGPPQ